VGRAVLHPPRVQGTCTCTCHRRSERASHIAHRMSPSHGIRHNDTARRFIHSTTASQPWRTIRPLRLRIDQTALGAASFHHSLHLPPFTRPSRILATTCPSTKHVYLVLRWCSSSSSAISSSSWHVSCGFAIHAVVHANRALKSFAPALRNWSPTCNVCCRQCRQRCVDRPEHPTICPQCRQTRRCPR